MMSHIFRSLVGQTMIILMAGLMLFHVLSILVFTSEKLETVLLTDEIRILEKVAAISRMFVDTPKEYHEVMIAALNAAMPDVQFRHGEYAPHAIPADSDEQIRNRLENLIDRPRVRVLFVESVALHWDHDGGAWHRMWFMVEAGIVRWMHGATMEQEMHMVVVMPDGHQVVFTTRPAANHVPLLRHATISVSLMGGAVLLFSWVAVRRLTTPLRQIVRATETFGRDLYAAPLPEEGTLETRKVARAFNAMNASIREFVEQRTRMIAAISHDLRTPLTQLRLRLEFIQPQEDRSRMAAIMDEMDAMLTATLAFSRDAAADTEARRRVNLAGLLATICDDLQDLGMEVSRQDWARLPYECRPSAMKRALTNILLNAVRHGGAAWVDLEAGNGQVLIEIRDPGDGIPAEEWENVFKPFYRLDAAATRQGAGLGLSVARSVIRDHGGEIAFQRPQDGGFVVRVMLPYAAATGVADVR
ncbi:MAG: HAMP domain-containing protein [Magnetococcales bacterium]|nr:HAMP domain-containing protein [Magnetococcales bacterium]